MKKKRARVNALIMICQNIFINANYLYIAIYIQKYIVEIHTSNIIIVKNHNADVNSTGFIYQSS